VDFDAYILAVNYYALRMMERSESAIVFLVGGYRIRWLRFGGRPLNLTMAF
jgi:hypothetical protein